MPLHSRHIHTDHYADKPHILVVDDDERIRGLLSRYLKEQDFVIMTAQDAGEARALMSSFVFDACIADIMMPGESGLDFTRWLTAHYDVPVLMLTALGETDDRIKGLEIGADDYLPKPFEPKELVLRLRSLLKRTKMKRGRKGYYIGPWFFDPDSNELVSGEKNVALTNMEIALLRVLLERSGEVVSREYLAEKTGMDAAERAIDVQVTRIRKKIEMDSRKPRFLRTVRGKGYVLRN